MAGLLIVNADDWGGHEWATDRIAECFAAGRITSASAMVYMEDSDRAAALARKRRLPRGLHLNVTQELSDPAAPAAIAQRQALVATRFWGAGRRTRLSFDPRLAPPVKRCVEDQLLRFFELYGHAPDHLDGHNHAHLSPTVLLGVPRTLPVRGAQSPTPGEERTLGALLRAVRRRAIAMRHGTTDFCFDIERLHPALGGSRLDAALALCLKHTVELVVHPDRGAQFELLMSDEWAQLLEGRPLGSWRDLARV
jgi:predicted glycoside hydrolase/deacetylase ChbG (UPF0249 family)